MNVEQDEVTERQTDRQPIPIKVYQAETRDFYGLFVEQYKIVYIVSLQYVKSRRMVKSNTYRP